MAGQGTAELGAWYFVGGNTKAYVGDEVVSIESNWRKFGLVPMVDARFIRIWYDRVEARYVFLVHESLRIPRG